MSPSPSRRTFATIATPLLALAFTGASTVGASSVPGEPPPGSSAPLGSDPTTDIVVHDEGASDPRINLNDIPVVAGSVLHSVKTNESSGEIHLSGAETLDAAVAGTTTVEQTAEVTVVAPDGGYTVIRTVDSYNFVVTEGPANVGSFLQGDDELEPLVGIPLLQVYDADRDLLSVAPVDTTVMLTSDQEAALEEILADGADSARVPDAELGIGATWTSYLEGSKGATGEFELVAIDATEATINLTVDADAASIIDPESPLQDVAGTVTGSGSLVADLTNWPAGDSVLALTVDVTGTTQGVTLAMTYESTMTNVVTPG